MSQNGRVTNGWMSTSLLIGSSLSRPYPHGCLMSHACRMMLNDDDKDGTWKDLKSFIYVWFDRPRLKFASTRSSDYVAPTDLWPSTGWWTSPGSSPEMTSTSTGRYRTIASRRLLAPALLCTWWVWIFIWWQCSNCTGGFDPLLRRPTSP